MTSGLGPSEHTSDGLDEKLSSRWARLEVEGDGALGTSPGNCQGLAGGNASKFSSIVGDLNFGTGDGQSGSSSKELEELHCDDCCGRLQGRRSQLQFSGAVEAGCDKNDATAGNLQRVGSIGCFRSVEDSQNEELILVVMINDQLKSSSSSNGSSTE